MLVINEEIFFIICLYAVASLCQIVWPISLLTSLPFPSSYLEGLGQLLDVCGRALFVKALELLQLLVQLAARRILENEIHAGGVVKVAVEAQDVRVAQMRLDFNLAPQLVLHVGLLQLALEKHLA